MSLLQSYIFRQALWPLLVALASLGGLALLTQSLSTLELIVQNRQGAGTFFRITVLALPQLVSIILPMAVLLAALYALNRLNTDSELVVARATGINPWQIASPVLRLALLAAVAHLLINLFVQPQAFREMRAALLDVRMDMASQMITPGEFTSPASGLTLYAQDILSDGTLLNMVIHDARDAEEPPTLYVAKTGTVERVGGFARLTLRDGSIQQRVDPGALDYVAFGSHQVDLSDVIATDTVLRLKKSDRFLHELLFPNAVDLQRADDFTAEAHARLSAPLYSPALALIALVFLARGRHRRMGYGGSIAAAALMGFTARLVGFSLASAAEANPVLNAAQYALPLGVIAVCLLILTLRRPVPATADAPLALPA